MQTVDLTQLPSTQLGSDDQFEAASRANAFLGRLQLFTKGNAINEGLIPPGTYGIPESDKKIAKLGPEIDVLPLAKRLKALDLSDKEAIINNYDPNSEQFENIKERSKEQNSGCMWGTSLLGGRRVVSWSSSGIAGPIGGDIAVFLPLVQPDIDRKAAAGADVSQMKPHFANPCTLKVRLAKSQKGYSWHVPDVQPCSTITNLPSQESILIQTNLLGGGSCRCGCSFIPFDSPQVGSGRVVHASQIVALLFDNGKMANYDGSRVTLLSNSVTTLLRRKP